MTLKQLVYFLKIAETGNLTKAAQLLHISQPPLSYQLKLLEEELGVELFIRDARNIQITNEGIYLQDKATQILTLVNKTAAEIRRISTQGEICLNIGAVTSVNHNLLPKIVNVYKIKYPKAVFNIHDGSSFRIIELLNNHIIDIGILREPFPKDLYSYVPVLSKLPGDDKNDYFVVVGMEHLFPSPEELDENVPSDSVRLQDIVHSPLIIHRRFEDIFMEKCAEIGVHPTNIVCRNDNIMSTIEWIYNGLGLGIMPFTSSLLISNPKVVIKKIIQPSFCSNLYIVWNQGHKLSHPLQYFIDLFQQEMDKN